MSYQRYWRMGRGRAGVPSVDKLSLTCDEPARIIGIRNGGVLVLSSNIDRPEI